MTYGLSSLAWLATWLMHMGFPRAGMLHMVMIGTMHTIPVPADAWYRVALRVLYQTYSHRFTARLARRRSHLVRFVDL